MRAFLIASSLIALAGGSATQAAAGPAPTPTTVDPAKFYTGTWYEIARRPMSLTNGCVAGGTTYTRMSGDAVKVEDFCHKGSPSGALKTIGGPAHISDPGANAKLHVSYRVFGFVTLPRDYWVLEHARRLQLVHLRGSQLPQPLDLYAQPPPDRGRDRPPRRPSEDTRLRHDPAGVPHHRVLGDGPRSLAANAANPPVRGPGREKAAG